MSHAPTVPSAAAWIPRRRASVLRGLVARPEPAIAIASACLALLLWNAPFTHDVVWQLWLARQMNAGARLYVDLVEVNPPLWFWMGAAVQRLAATLGLPATSLLAVGVSAWIGSATLLLARCLPPHRPAASRLMLAAAFATMALLPLTEFAQREQLTLIGAIPWIALVAARSEGSSIPARIALSIGTLAAPALCLKPHFLIVPFALEMWLLWRRPRAWRPLRPETIVLGAFALGYFVAILAFAPAFVTRIIPFVRATYWVFDGSWSAVLGNPMQVLWPLVAWAFVRLMRGRDARPTPLATAFLVAGGCFVLVYFAQQKGWQYHAIPATGCLVLAVAAQVAAGERPIALLRANLPALAVLLAPLLFGVVAGLYHNPKEARMAAALAGMRPGEGVAVLTEDTTLAWPAMERAGLRWSSRYYAVWMAPVFAEAAARGPLSPEVRALADEVRAATVADLRCGAPRRILLDRVPANRRMRRTGFDLARFFFADTGFARVLASYRRVGTAYGFDIYERSVPPARPAGCPPRA